MSQPFPTPQADAEAIEVFAASCLEKRLGTCDPLRLAIIRTDALKQAAELRLLTISQTYSQRKKRK